MKISLRKILDIETTLDSSETVMFNQGRKHSVKIKSINDEENIDFDVFDEINFSVQLERSSNLDSIL